MPADAGRFSGFVDGFDRGIIAGWALDRKYPSEPAMVEVYIDDILVCEAVADLNRPDLAAVSPASTHKGFRIDLTRYTPGKVSVVHSKTMRVVPIPRGQCIWI